MSLTLRVNGVNYTDFISASVQRFMETAASQFSFTATDSLDTPFPIDVDDLAEILADGVTVSKGYIEDNDSSGDATSDTVMFAGRSLLNDFIDSTVGALKEFEGQVNLQDIIRAVLDSLTLTNIKIINEAGNIKNFDATDITSAETGQNAFDFIELFARKRQVLITTNGDGDLVIARAGRIVSPFNIKNIVGANDNNVLSSTVKHSVREEFNRYTANSQLNPFNIKPGSNARQVSDQVSSRFNTLRRKSRVFEFNAEESSDSFTLRDRAGWEANIRRARAKTYTCVVQGHTVDGVPWTPNRLHRVDDDFRRVHAMLLLKAVTYGYGVDGGSTTSLGFTNKLAYTLEVEQTAREATVDSFAGGF